MRALLTNPKLNRQGVVGVSPLPGTSTVYNRATQSLMPCDIVSCPFATLHNIMSSDAQVRPVCVCVCVSVCVCLCVCVHFLRHSNEQPSTNRGESCHARTKAQQSPYRCGIGG